MNTDTATANISCLNRRFEASMLDSHEKRPLYLQLVDTLLKQIAAEYKSDDRLPTEKDLCEEYAVSRTTVRLAMSELERRGAIYRVQGKGSFVAAPSEDGTDSLLSFDFWAHCDGVDRDTASIEVSDLSSKGVSIVTSQMFGCRRPDGITHLEAVYRISGRAVAIDHLIFSPAGSGVVYSESEGLQGCLQQLERALASTREDYLLAPLSDGDAERFDLSSGTTLQINHYAYDDSGRLVFIAERKVLSNQISYQNIAFKS